MKKNLKSFLTTHLTTDFPMALFQIFVADEYGTPFLPGDLIQIYLELKDLTPLEDELIMQLIVQKYRNAILLRYFYESRETLDVFLTQADRMERWFGTYFFLFNIT